MRLASALLVALLATSTLSIFNTNGDLDTNAGVNFQLLFTQKQSELVSFTRECNNKCNNYEQTIRDLRDQLSNVNAALREASSANKQLSSDLEKCKRTSVSIEQLNVQITNLTTVNAQLTAQNNKYDSDMNKFAQMVADLKQQIETYKANGNKANATIEQMNTTIVSNQTTIANFRIQIEQLNVQITNLNVSKDNEAKLRLVIVDLQNQIDAAARSYSELNGKYRAQSEQIAKFQAQLESCRNQDSIIRDLKSQLADYAGANDKCSKNITELNIAIQKITIDISSRTEEYKAQIVALQAQVDRYVRENGDLKKDSASCSANVADLNNKLKNIEILNNIIVELKQRITAAEQERTSLNAQIAKLNAQIENGKACEADNKSLLVQINTLNVKIVEINKNNNECDKRAKNFEAISRKLYNDLQAFTDKIDLSSVNGGKNTTVLIGQSLKADY